MPGLQQKPTPGRPPKLPAGLDPVTAGRFGLWLFGLRNQQAAKKRTTRPRHVDGSGVLNAFVRLAMPWTVEEYPGYRRLLADLFNVKILTVDKWIYSDRGLPLRHAARMAEICRERSAAYAALAAEFEAWPKRGNRPLKRRHRGG